MTTLDHLHAIKASANLIYDEDKVANAFDRIAEQINQDFKDKNPVILAAMVGGMIPAAEICKRLDILFELDYLHATRYRGKTAGGEIQWMATPNIPLLDRNVLIIDDILDEGYTLWHMINNCEKQNAASVKTAVLLNKIHDRRYNNIQADYQGLRIEDKYVFGCGMDYKGYFRGKLQVHSVD